MPYDNRFCTMNSISSLDVQTGSFSNNFVQLRVFLDLD